MLLTELNVIDDEPKIDPPWHELPIVEPADWALDVFNDVPLEVAVQRQIGVHLGLDAAAVGAFVEHFTADAGVGLQLNLDRTNPFQYMRNGRIQRPTAEEVTFAQRQLHSIETSSTWGGGVVLRGFEAWWQRDRLEAESLVRDLPRLLHSAIAGRRTLHLALPELSDQVAEDLTQVLREAAEANFDLPEIPIFKHQNATPHVSPVS